MNDWNAFFLIIITAANFMLTLTLRAEIHRKWSRNRE